MTAVGYPVQWESDVVLKDGGTLHVRPIRPDDGERVTGLRERMSEQSLYYRFMSMPPPLTEDRIRYFTHLDYSDRMALVGVLGDEIVAVARYDRIEGTGDAEVAFAVDDAHQGRGIGTILLEHLAAAARERGVQRFVADTLAENRRMRDVFRSAGWEVSSELQSGVVSLSFPISETDHTREVVWERERAAEAASIRQLLTPRSIAVIGASRRPGTIGHELFLNLLRGNFEGPVYPVHPSAGHVAGVHAYPAVSAIPDPVDLAVVVVPAEHVIDVVRDCGHHGVRSLVVISAGFSEVGSEGQDVEHSLVSFARSYGMRVVGPNCMGVVNTDPAVRMNATFAPHQPRPGPLGFMSQSGAFGIALLEWANRLRLGVSSFVSVGNKVDVSGNDLLQFWETDDRTAVALLYLESFGNPRKFARVARRVARTKPIIAVKGGRTRAGTRAAASHTAAAASPDTAVDALFHQTGVIRVDAVSRMFDVAQLLAFQPLPNGPRVAIISNGGGPGILAADACERSGLEVPELEPRTQETLRGFLQAGAAVSNPIDLVASASPENFRRSVEIVLADERVDALVVQFTPPLVTRADDVAQALSEAVAGSTKPVAAVFLATEEVPPAARAETGGVDLPVYYSPEDAVHALARAVEYAEWRRQPEGSVPDRPLDRDRARAVTREFLLDHPDGGWLDPDRSNEILAAFEIETVRTEFVTDADTAGRAAESLGYPVALKAVGADLVHKTDVGGVHLGLTTSDAVTAAYQQMMDAIGPAAEGAIVQPMVVGVETIVGVVQDPSFGPLVMFGLGGITTELLADRSFRVLPLTDRDASDLVRSIRGAPLLFGYRGSDPVAVDALEALLVNVGRLADEVPEIAEMDLNPVMVSTSRAQVVDVKIRVAPRPPTAPAVRRMRDTPTA